MSEIYGLMYYSFCDPDLDTTVLQYIVGQARLRNQLKRVTGQLHFENGIFLQWIEGSLRGVEDVFGHIAVDPHHVNLKVIHSSFIPVRHFGTWDMAFSNNHDQSLLSFMQSNDLSLENDDKETIMYLIHFLGCASMSNDQQIGSVKSAKKEHSVTRNHYVPARLMK